VIKKIAPDKWRHFFGGIVMGAVLQGAAWWLFPANLRLATGVVFIVVVVISYGFELFSKVSGKGYYEVLDAVAAAVGGVLGMALVIGFA
jgi:hypothetical protein